MLNCEAFDELRCQSCQLIKKEYSDGLEIKIKGLEALFKGTEVKFNNPICSTDLYQHRNKAKFVIGGTMEAPVIGIPKPQDKFEVNNLLDCPIHSDGINQLALDIQSLILEFKLVPYDIKTRRGEFKYLIISSGYKTKELSVRFGMRSSEALPRVKKLFHKLVDQYPNWKVCVFEIQPKHAAVFEGEEIFISDEKYISHDFEDIKLLSSSSNFFQINSAVAKSLYDQVFQFIQDKNIDCAIDLFCGVGGFAQQMSRVASKVYGIELSGVAIECAKESTKRNNLSNIEFICDDANNFKNHISENIDLILVNPPRRGIGKNLCLLINEMEADYFIYSSCNANSLRQDAEFLADKYELLSLTPVDMFPLTKHLEVLTFWKKRVM